MEEGSEIFLISCHVKSVVTCILLIRIDSVEHIDEAHAIYAQQNRGYGSSAEVSQTTLLPGIFFPFGSYH